MLCRPVENALIIKIVRRPMKAVHAWGILTMLCMGLSTSELCQKSRVGSLDQGFALVRSSKGRPLRQGDVGIVGDPLF